MHPLRELAARLHAALHQANLINHPLHDEVHAVAEHLDGMADADEAPAVVQHDAPAEPARVEPAPVAAI